MLNGTLPCLWVVPYAGRNPPRIGRGPHSPPGTGGVAPLVERFEATPPLYGSVGNSSSDCGWVLTGEQNIELY